VEAQWEASDSEAEEELPVWINKFIFSAVTPNFLVRLQNIVLVFDIQ